MVIFPTDTVYGIGCRSTARAALERIFSLKGRDAARPIQLLLSDTSRVGEYAASIPQFAWELMEKHWPGGLTILLPALRGLPGPLAGTERKVGLRVPGLPALQELIERAGGALAATSANLSGQPSPWSVEEIAEDIRRGVDYIIDSGPLNRVPASTVVDCAGERPRVQRFGAVALERPRASGTKR